jgi:hypothetical protein
MMLRLALMAGVYIWGKKYLRYPALGAVGTFVAFGLYSDKQARDNAGPYGYRQTVHFTQGIVGLRLEQYGATPPDGTRVSLRTNEFRSQSIASAFGTNANDPVYLEKIDKYENGHEYATGDDLMRAL